MRLTEAIRSAISAILANALRSLLTMLGIVIGVAAVIAMVAIGAGARNLVDRQIRSLGANLALITPGNVTQGGARLGAGAASTLTDEDADAIRSEIEGVTAAAPIVRGTSQVVVGANNWSTSVYAVDSRVTRVIRDVRSSIVQRFKYLRTKPSVMHLAARKKLQGQSTLVGRPGE